jgi:type VI secretion system protein VasG
MVQNASRLLRRLNPYCAQALSAAATLCQSRAHGYIRIEHWLLKLFEQGEGDLTLIARRYEWDLDALWRGLLEHLDTLPRSVHSKPQLCGKLQQLISNAWLRASLDSQEQLRSAHLLGALLESPELLACEAAWPLFSISKTQLQHLFVLLDQHSEERPQVQQEAAIDQAPASIDGLGKPSSAIGNHDAFQAVLDRFTQDVTAKAREGQIDPVFGRDDEIRQVIDILSRRRKNNPLLVGEPGVGKTALVEGLALRIVEGNVPDSLKPVSVRTLDLGLLQAGAGVKGEFEQRLKNVIDAVQQSANPVLLFIDEAHTLIGAGNQAGGADAANLLKPALARGELRTIAATTWSEYKQYFERDAALERRFQKVKVDEPDDHNACLMLRGLKARYASHHGVHIQDAAVQAAVTLSRRYLTGRQLPDKAVDLLDTASARVRMSLDCEPQALVRLKAGQAALGLERQALAEDAQLCDCSVDERLALIDAQRVLERLPGLEALCWNDGSPLADEVTREWISQHVCGNRPQQWLPAPTVAATGEDPGILSLEGEALAQADSDGVEHSLAWLAARPGIHTGRQRWLLRLLMARVAEQYGKSELAIHLLGELDASGQRHGLAEWETELSFEVKARLLKLLRLKAQRNDADKPGLTRRMEALLAALVAVDPVRAAVLCG